MADAVVGWRPKPLATAESTDVLMSRPFLGEVEPSGNSVAALADVWTLVTLSQMRARSWKAIRACDQGLRLQPTTGVGISLSATALASGRSSAKASSRSVLGVIPITPARSLEWPGSPRGKRTSRLRPFLDKPSSTIPLPRGPALPGDGRRLGGRAVPAGHAAAGPPWPRRGQAPAAVASSSSRRPMHPRLLPAGGQGRRGPGRARDAGVPDRRATLARAGLGASGAASCRRPRRRVLPEQ